MGATDQKFWFSLLDQDQAWGTDVRAVWEIQPGADNSTQLVFGNGTASAVKTVDPATANSSTSDLRTTHGWAWDVADTSRGMGGATNARRIIPAGNWYFALLVGIPACALGGSITCQATYSVYRVAAGTFARTLLFTQIGGTKTQTNSLNPVDVVADAVTSNTPQIILEPGETIHIGINITSQQTGTPVVGTTVQNTQTIRLGNNTSAVTVPAPGIRTLYERSASDTVATTDSALRTVSRFRAASDSVQTTESGARSIVTQRGSSDSIPTTDSGARTLARFRAASDTVPTTDQAARSVNYQRAGADSVPTTESGVRSVVLARGAIDNIPTLDSAARSVNYYRGATDDLAGGVTVIEVPKPQPIIIVDDDIAMNLGGPLYTRV